MLDTLHELASGFTTWRPQVLALAKVAMGKQVRGAALGWVWLFVKPAVYILSFWFALYIGIKGGGVDLAPVQYMLWLAAGIIPWFFMSGCMSSGPKQFQSYSYLVNKMVFPVSLIPVFVTLSAFAVHVILVVCLVVGYFAAGGTLTVYFIQLPFILLGMFVFWTAFCLLTATLCAFSKDLTQFIAAIQTPIFWLSGIIFSLDNVNSSFVHFVLNFDPVAFFAMAYRKVLVASNAGWVWDNPMQFGIGVGIIVATCLAALVVYARLRKDLADVL